ncbi:hypothetical protein ONZ45_g3355 [Pleurotus djamor]|nr:hypothetical protein ONZ45_g3355 [Pleurotus djamor]
MFSAANLTFACIAAFLWTVQVNGVVIEHTLGGEFHTPLHFIRYTTAADVPTFQGCDPTQRDAIVAAIQDAQDLINNANQYIDDFGVAGPAPNDPRLSRYKTWFGEYSPNRFLEFTLLVRGLRSARINDFTYSCNVANCEKEYLYKVIPGTLGIYAFVHQDSERHGIVNLCPPFFRALQSSGTTRAHVLVHETAHFNTFARPGANIDTTEWYTSVGAWTLARSSPDTALKNADNYAWFSRNARGCELLTCNLI